MCVYGCVRVCVRGACICERTYALEREREAMLGLEREKEVGVI